MTISKHAQTRIQQRGIPAALLGIIEECGRVSQTQGGAQQIFLGRREAEVVRCRLKHILQALDKAQGTVLIVKDGCILTAYRPREQPCT